MKKMYKLLTLILVISMLLGLMALPAGATGITKTPGNTSKDKVAEWHDDSQTIADVTLRVPGSSQVLGSDIIYIVGSYAANEDGTPNVEGDVLISSLVDTMEEMVAKGTHVNFGMVPFSSDTVVAMPLTRIDESNIEQLPTMIAEALATCEALYDGVNMENALVKAKKMFSESELKDHPERQHLVMITSGLTYFFNSGENNENVATVPVNYTGVNRLWYSNKAWQRARLNQTNTYPIPKGIVDAYNKTDKTNTLWEFYWSYIDQWAKADIAAGDKVVYDACTIESGNFLKWYNSGELVSGYSSTGYGPAVSKNEMEERGINAADFVTLTAGANPLTNAAAAHAIGYERAMYEAYEYAKANFMDAGINFYPIYNALNVNYTNGNWSPASYNANWTNQYIGHSFVDMLAGGEGKAVMYDKKGDKAFFDSIKDKIIYTCTSGSYVEDYMGYSDDVNYGYNFDFVQNPEMINLTVGGVKYTTALVDTKENYDFSVAFTAPDAAEPSFWLDYVKGNGTTEEKFVWTFGEDIKTFAPAELNYQVELVQAPAKYPNEVCEVETNQNATLYPAGSDEGEGFPVPKLTLLPKYTVTYEYIGVIPANVPDLPESATYIVGADVTTAAPLTLEGYTFYGWQNPHTEATCFETPAHDITITGYWMPENNFVDPPIGIKTDKENFADGYKYDVTIAVPGVGDAIKTHDEIILIIDASYSCDEEWAEMKSNILQIGEKVLDGNGRTQITVISFGMGDYVVAEGVKTVEELEDLLPELPGGLLYGRSSTNCESGFLGAMKYIDSKKDQLGRVDVVYISDFGVNTDETERVFDEWEVMATKFGPLLVAQSVFENCVRHSDTLPEAFVEFFGERFEGLTRDEILTTAFVTNKEIVSNEEYLAFADQIWTDVYAYSGLTRGELYPVSVVERAFVKYDNDNGSYIQDAFYYTTYNSQLVTYNDRWARSEKAGEQLAAMQLVNELYMVRYSNHAQGWWAKNVDGAKYYQADSVANLIDVLTPVADEMAKSNFTNVVITDYMSKWVILDQTSIYIQNDKTGDVIWTIKDGWKIETDRPTDKTPVIVEVVENNVYYAEDGKTLETNVNGVLYKLTWNVKDDCLLRTDNYSLHYTVTVDVDEAGFVPGVEYPANGHTFVDYDKYEGTGNNDIQVPNVTIPAYTVTYLNGEIELQKTETHKTGDEIPACETPSSFTANGYRYTFARWSLRSGVEGENNTVGNTNLVYEAVYTASVDETQVSVQKIWDDDDDFEGARPENITIRLYADNVEIEAVTVTAEMGWTYTFENLPLNLNGEKIVYTVAEDAVEGYEMIELSGDAENGFVIVNQYQIVVEDPEPPRTGDPIALVMAMATISMMGLAVIVLQRKKFN